MDGDGRDWCGQLSLDSSKSCFVPMSSSGTDLVLRKLPNIEGEWKIAWSSSWVRTSLDADFSAKPEFS